MEKDWEKIYTTTEPHKSTIAKAILKENGIEAVIINKKDSSYGTFGELELYTQRENVLKAINVLKEKNV